MTSSPPKPTYKSTFSLPYSPHSPLNTLDIHTPTTPPLTPSYHLLYIHGGAFRDPLVTSTSLLPSLESIFSTSNSHIAAVASVNYRLSPHPHHPTHPSLPEDESRNVKWPTHIEDVRDAIVWLREYAGWRGKEWIVCGHSVGGSMAVMLGLQPYMGEAEGGGKWGTEREIDGLKGVICVEGIYDFVALRDAHLPFRDVYEAFTTGAFGPEEEGGWERGNVLRCGRKVREGVEVVLVVHSRADELVEWGQAEGMVGVLRKEGRDGVGVLVEVDGGHEEVVTEGVVVGKVVEQAVGMLVKNASGGI